MKNCSNHNINNDIKEFIKHGNELMKVIDRIREYYPEAHLFVTPQQLNLIISSESKEPVAEVFNSSIECGDW